jgi:hypothetical protein
MLLLAIAGVPGALAAEDYALSPLDPGTAAFYDRLGTTPAAVFGEVAAGVDAARYLRQDDLESLRRRMVESVPPRG